MVGNKGERDETDAIEPLAAGEGADDDLVEGMAGPQEQAAVDAPAGHLHQGSTIRDKAQTSGHAYIRRKNVVYLTPLFKLPRWPQPQDLCPRALSGIGWYFSG